VRPPPPQPNGSHRVGWRAPGRSLPAQHTGPPALPASGRCLCHHDRPAALGAPAEVGDEQGNAVFSGLGVQVAMKQVGTVPATASSLDGRLKPCRKARLTTWATAAGACGGLFLSGHTAADDPPLLPYVKPCITCINRGM